MSKEKTQKGFEKVLNSHGYGFQYSVLKLASDLYWEQKSTLFFESAEFPVEVNGYGTRIDFILRRSKRPPIFESRPFFLLAECKRVNPALSNWCFVRAPFTQRVGYANSLVLEFAQLNENNVLNSSAKIRPLSIDKFYHVALEVKSDEKGDSQGAGRGVIEEAATQVLRGLNGMVNFLATHFQVLGEQRSIDFLPVIFTTAQIWTSNVDLSAADISKGTVDLTNEAITNHPWIFYQYSQSPGLKHLFAQSRQAGTLGEIMESEYVRTIAIVSAQGIEGFLNWATHIDLW